MYVAATRFADLKDGGRIYEAGEQYPRPGFVVSEKRIAELAGSDNRMGYPLIEAVVTEAPSEAVERPAEAFESKADKDISAEAKPASKPRRSRKKE